LPHLIDETAIRPARNRDHEEESTMLKTISAALLAVSVLAAPAMATTTAKISPAIKTEHVKKNALTANAKMVRHHHAHYRHHRYTHLHKKGMKSAASRNHKFSKVSAKHVTRAVKHG
jgi:Ni/Co efflux regulator RcnB